MKNVWCSSSFIVAVVFILTGCAGNFTDNRHERGYYEEEPAKYLYDYDKVWKATVDAANELDWEIKSEDKESGTIEFLPSYVYNHEFRKYKRIYSEPTSEQAKESDVRSYLKKISYWDKKTPRQAPPNPQYVKENLNVKVKGYSNNTTVKAAYDIQPHFDYNMGYLGEAKTKGKLENLLYKNIGDILASYKDEIPPPPAPEVMDETFVLFDIFFDFDKDNIREDAKPVLLENAKLLNEEPELTIVIHGYADVRGTEEYNIDLAMRRAMATKRFLIDFGGIDHRRIISLAKGETEKFAPGITEEEYELNRRSHIIPVKPKAPVIYPE